MICNIPNLDLVNINAYTIFGEIFSNWFSRYLAETRLLRTDGMMDNPIQYSPLFQAGAINMTLSPY